VQKQLASDYWKPDWNVDRIEGSLIDQIFLSPGMMHEYEPQSTRVGGMCADGKAEYEGAEIPEYYETISDHCPVYITLHADEDDD
jgi:exonuclease III